MQNAPVEQQSESSETVPSLGTWKRSHYTWEPNKML